MSHNFKQLKIWQKSMDLADLTYIYCKSLPRHERYNLIDQINRCSCSIPSNIAEGSGKRSPLQFGEYLSTSLTSCYELETHLIICQRRMYGDPNLLDKGLDLVIQVQKMIFTFREKILHSN